MNNQLAIALDCLRQDIEVFCATEGWPYSQHIELDGWYSFYVRRATQNINGTRHLTFDLANCTVVADKQGLGIFDFCLEEFKHRAEKHNRVLYIENVLFESQHGIYLRRGFERVVPETVQRGCGSMTAGIDYDVCFFCDPLDLVAEVED